MKKIVLTGGGTAGHVMPNIALLPYLNNCEIHYIGGNGIEKELLSGYKNVTYHEIPCVKYIRGVSMKNLLIPFKLIKSLSAARKIIKEIKPDVIFTKGGYVSLPVALSAGKIPVITHESDMSMGLTNKLIRRKCKYVCTAFDVTATGIKNGVYTGAILRRELRTGTRKSSSPTLLVMGGSLGSAAINNCLSECLKDLTKKYNVIHIVGKGNLSDQAMPHYKQIEFTSSMADVYADADLIISRGGANSLFEIAALGKKALIIPLPKGASRGDQIENAAYFSERGLVKVLPQNELNAERLIKELNALEAFTPASFHVDGTKKVASLILSV
ncbi:MAG: UDP-N-acetylglucosamine--N-acetylmuramyl-(pentapeptide) pyrophosphoryl-undecaprenol N-acetylglucosamine transferase [Clostridiales bacterium]|nr:UDP-N-acetylglucosamine--N-acetylmuramyl-(pentapeptide) pyrophosphoryl-undecaprenol N-acetylglucosamine transferase [Clostridiales bacterium]